MSDPRRSAPRPFPQTGDPAPAGLLERESRRRRRSVYRSLALIALVLAAMVVLTVLTRDVQDVDYCRRELQYAIGRLSQNREALPLVLPQRNPRDSLVSHYRYRPFNTTLLQASSPVGIACCDERHRLLLRPDGRNVLLFDGARYDVIWMAEADFQARAESLGLADPAR